MFLFLFTIYCWDIYEPGAVFTTFLTIHWCDISTVLVNYILFLFSKRQANQHNHSLLQTALPLCQENKSTICKKKPAPQSAYLQIFADNNYDNGLSEIYCYYPNLNAYCTFKLSFRFKCVLQLRIEQSWIQPDDTLIKSWF